MKNLLSRLLLFSITIAIAFTSCMTPAKYARKRMDSSIVPADFDPNKHILLLAEMPQRRNPSERNTTVTRKLDNVFKEHYKYRYEIVSPKEIYERSGKYQDTSVYKYAVINSLSSYTHSTTTTVTNTTSAGTSSHSVSPSATTTQIDFHFYDRAQNKHHSQTGAGHANLNGISRAFIVLIDRARQGKK